MKSPLFPVEPATLRWAIERSGLGIETIARRVGVHPAKFASWQSGHDSPSWAQARRLARILRISLGCFLLSEPPITVPRDIVDFRALPEGQRGQFSPELEALLNDAIRKSQFLRERRRARGEGPLEWIGQADDDSPAAEVAESIRQTLELEQPEGRRKTAPNERLRGMVTAAERAGILVLQASTVGSNARRRISEKEFRGFAIADSYAPVIFLNARDSIAGRVFTFVHELAHLWRGTSGVSDPLSAVQANASPIERYCNQVAAQLLMPSENFRLRWERCQEASTEKQAERTARFFGVSTQAALVRAYYLSLISRDEFERAFRQQMARLEAKPPSVLKRRSFYLGLASRCGRVLLAEVLEAVRSGELLYRDAAMLLNVPLRIIDKLLLETRDLDR